jgi:AraC-like DNA-binding protein
LKLIADAVGYGSEAALARAFKAHSGQTPRVAAGTAARQPDNGQPFSPAVASITFKN